MSRSQVHIFWGAPVAPLKMTISQGTASTTNAWEQIQLLYKQQSLHMKAENQELENLKDYQIPETAAFPDVLSGHLLTAPVARSVQMEDGLICSASETQSMKSQKAHPSGRSDTPDVQISEFKDRVQHLPEEEKYQCDAKKIIDEQSRGQSDPCAEDFQTDVFALDHKCTAGLDLDYTEQIDTGPGTVRTKPVPTEHEGQSQEVFSSDTKYESESEGAAGTASDQKISPDTEFLCIMSSSQRVLLAHGNNIGQDCLNKGTVNMEVEPTGCPEGRRAEDNLVKPREDSKEGSESEQSQAYSLELFSPVCPESESSHVHRNPGKSLENNRSSQNLCSNEENLPAKEECIELCSSGMLCSQLSASCQSAAIRSRSSKDISHHSKALSEVHQVSKKPRMDSNTRESAKTVPWRIMSEFKAIKKISLIKNCDSKSQKYNCLVMVLTPCHVKEISVKSGPHSGSKVPLATIVVIDQSEMKRRVVLWRTAAFWALTVFPGDIILLTDVTVYEDQWIGETVLQSTFTSQLVNLGSYSYVRPEKYSNVVTNVILQDLLAYVSSKHSYLKDLPQRQHQKMSTVQFVELEQLQPDTLVHAVLRVVDVTVLTEALYSYRGQKQRKVVLTVEQVQGHHYVLVLWGPGAAWSTQLQRKKDCIWEFKYLFVQRNCILENLELHTTLWSSCECLLDDDTRAISFKAKFQKSIPSFVKTSDLATHLKDKYSGVVLIKAKVSELVFTVTAAQKIALNARSSLKHIFSSLPNITYAGCAQCGSELETDENRIYRQCLSCLPFSRKKTFYRPALMTIVDGRHHTCVRVGSKMMEQILLNISPDCLNRVIVPSSEVTYGLVAADLLHSLLAVGAEPCVLKIQSFFELDENSYPLHQDFFLLDFCPDSCKMWSLGLSLRSEEDTDGIPRKE
ncbi:shieldin complex subunit 2 isoform X3 [Arvicola amphibius]|nr:shieldin complex subunit 2 isoform X3 [Arvicola amphibius]XP_038204403.1 shieldin complex subunit 2 isoform X3 [Arvicola amphibius]XP_038204404.1 shieldin complex subunit 2 isoform X3 [Arvicola amphibius]XP_038204405.1 shieldin complex subunit 2 isoform X3 [Arvicola amphibius]XP_038204406.1 shieldin complex subunit 2 isoform X3 [Arvicola amphibius]XP_038204407.1 shieldin complex subunit 2 isoform X3 [Arvicola amphibius]XP_038204408.1 shieldin complex subunit 2 isoform X3 [Arvicola amphibiu